MFYLHTFLLSFVLNSVELEFSNLMLEKLREN